MCVSRVERIIDKIAFSSIFSSVLFLFYYFVKITYKNIYYYIKLNKKQITGKGSE